MNQKNEKKAKNGNLNAAREKKNDEFYTQYPDIEREMNSYLDYNKDVFRGKSVLCPCDDPEWSNFTKYFAQNFERLGLKKLVSTSYSRSGNRQMSLIEAMKGFDKDRHDTHGRVLILERSSEKSERIDIDKLEWKYLEGDGDFRSEEVTRLRDEADFIVTNPPFSLFREFIAWIMAGKKKFSIIGNMNAITYKEVFPMIKNDELWLGNGFAGGNAYFKVDEESKALKYSDGVFDKNSNLVKFRNCKWFTNIEHGRRHQPLSLMTMADNIKFSKHKEIKENGYLKYDNYNAIEVPYIDAIPSDYDGVMGVPISFLDGYCPEQFEIVTFRKGEDGKDLVFTREREREFNLTFESLSNTDCSDDWKPSKLNQWKDYLRLSDDNQKYKEPIDLFFPISTNLKNGLVSDSIIDGRRIYVRVLIRMKHVKE